jgi:hypothetical protein
MIYKLLMTELGYFRSKGVFSDLSIDTAADLSESLVISPGLETYFTAFKRKDKESTKLIQAGSYVYDFYAFLQAQHILDHASSIHFNIVGYTDRNINAMSLGPESLNILQTCAKIYRQDSGEEAIHDARARVLETIRANAAYSFPVHGEAFTQRIMDVAKESDGVHWIQPFEEYIEGFANSWDPIPVDLLQPDLLTRLGVNAPGTLNLLDAHKVLVTQTLEADEKVPFLFLTGNPGIGKTTAIVDFLNTHRDEGFLLIYVSPRKQVNLEVINKFRENDGKGPLGGNILALTTNAILIHDHGGQPTVQYSSSTIRGDQTKQGIKTGITFLDGEATDESMRHKHQSRLETLSDDKVWDHGEDSSGVMNSICDALYVTLHEQLSNQIVATIAVQSLKKTAGGGDTLSHLSKIFHDMVTPKNKVISADMDALAQRIKHIFIMIDEITGDEGGVAFLEGIERFIRHFELLQHGFNTKVIVADASIVDKRVIERHLAESSYEPDKIYFRRVEESRIPPLSLDPYVYKGKAACVINANSYPASRLHVTYNVCVECTEYDEIVLHNSKEHLVDTIQERLHEDIVSLWQRPDVSQMIVYVQDKKRLVKLITQLRGTLGSFELKEHYLEIHANISEADKEDVSHYKDKVRIIFMTASASRGLSFPNVTHMLIDVPRFEIEQNLMEIIQVIYRSRGKKEADQREKHLLFYLSDRAVYHKGDRDLSLRESTLHLLNILLILKTSVMTRIQGYGQIGQQRFMMIPIGGKSVLAAGETYIGKMSRFIADLRRESERRSGDEYKVLKDIYTELRELLGHADLRITAPKAKGNGREVRSDGLRRGCAQSFHTPEEKTYLSSLSTFTSKFEDAVYNGFHKLLEWERIELGYISSDLLIVSVGQKKIQERYLLDIGTKLRNSRGGNLWHALRKVAANKEKIYLESLQSAAKDALDLIDLLYRTSPEKIQQLSQDSQHADQYYVIPLITFLYEDSMKKYLMV